MTTALEGLWQSLGTDPLRPRVEYRGRIYTGADLQARIAARAQDLRQAGLQRGDRALIIVSDNLTAIEQLLACWWAGASGTLVDFRSPPARLEEWRQRIVPALVIGQRAMAGQAVHVQPRDPVGIAPCDIGPGPQAEDLALFVTSSGTTGLPKLTETLQGRLLWVLQSLNAAPRAIKQGTYLSAVSVAFSASCYIWLRLLLSGRKLLNLDLVYRLHELDQALQRPDVVETGLPPSLIRQLAALPTAEPPRYPNLRRLASVGGPARPQDKVLAVTRLSPFYTMNYSCIGVGLIAAIDGAEVLARPASCGRPDPSVRLEIRDGNRLCAAGEIGEIHVSSSRATNHRPGDLGWLDADGYLYITGRVQGMLSRAGVNFSAERLVSAALDCERVTDAAVATLRDADDADQVHLVVQAPPDDLDRVKDRIATHLRGTLAAAEYPDRVHVWPRLPLTPGGKVDSRALSDMLQEVLNAPDPA